MKKVTVTLDQEYVDLLDEHETDSRSGSLRDILDEYEDLQQEYEDLHTEYEDLRAKYESLQERLDSREDRIDQLEEQLARRSQIEEKVDVLAKRVDEEQDRDPSPPWPVRWWRWVRSRGEGAEAAD